MLSGSWLILGGLQLGCVKMPHEALLLMLVLLYGSSTMILRENERSRIRAVQMGIRRMDRILNAQIRKIWEVAKGVNERIDKNFL